MKRQFAFVVLCAVFGFGIASLAQQQTTQAVRDYVRSHLFGAGGYTELSNAYDSTVVPQLIEMLDSQVEEEYWIRVVALLGVIGDERAVDALIAFVERPAADSISQAHHDARREAIRALGFAIDRTGSERALSYLIQSLDPQIWRQRGIQGLGPVYRSYDEYYARLSVYAILGLTVSGHPRAGEALRSLQQSSAPESPTAEQAEFRRDLDDTLTTWLEVYDVVAEKGIAGTYEHYETQQRLEAERRLEEDQRLHESRQQPSEEPSDHC